MQKDLLNIKDQNIYKLMAENFGDEIFVTDGKGIVLFVNAAAASVVGKPVVEIIGKHVQELVDQGFFRPSVTLEVMEKKETVNIIQVVKDDKRVLCTGMPIFEEDNETISLILSTTKDLSMLNDMFSTIEEQKDEILALRELALEQEGYITGSADPGGIKSRMIKIAPLDIPVLIQGETGVGKGVVAKAIHKFGRGKDKPFVKINCGTIPETLIESELFGYEKGAFTGADKGGKKGKVEMAAGGTLFLDEIGEMPMALQVKLLDFIQDGSFTKVGGIETNKVETRIIAATNRNLKEMCERGEFRKDLYYRLNVVPFEIPPLRERVSDLDALIKHFMTECNSKYGEKKYFTESAMQLLQSYNWPGNVRELEHIIELLYVLTDGEYITEDAVSSALNQDCNLIKRGVFGVRCEGYMPLKDAKKEVERQLITRAYEEFGSTYKVAEILNVDQSTVAKLLKKYRDG